ncbi:tRNAHis-5'-guanylyltransferase [hydrothermal vent metagenome]|uniref:tRNA(His) guanylyltransferase n=1 Tax=hydrothermal vent metagenome TaxID=652676 RepID=A0A3B0YDC0_9ZZZZ
MKFSDLDKKMRIYETSNDTLIIPDIYIVARIDGRSFTRLTKQVHQFESPYDIRFRDIMVETVKHLMDCGFKVTYGYTQSDEISLLFSLNDNLFQRKERKLNSVLAGEASAKFSILLGDIGAFDCRLSQLPSAALVADYFRWRNEDAHRNCLNSYCYWTLRREGKSASNASAQLSGVSVASKNELLFQRGINFNNLPTWQKRGVGIYWEKYHKEANNPQTGQAVIASRNRLTCDFELPMKDEYNHFIHNFT